MDATLFMFWHIQYFTNRNIFTSVINKNLTSFWHKFRAYSLLIHWDTLLTKSGIIFKFFHSKNMNTNLKFGHNMHTSKTNWMIKIDLIPWCARKLKDNKVIAENNFLFVIGCFYKEIISLDQWNSKTESSSEKYSKWNKPECSTTNHFFGLLKKKLVNVVKKTPVFAFWRPH